MPPSGEAEELGLDSVVRATVALLTALLTAQYMGTRGTCACVMMSDSTDERCCDSQRHALRQLTPRSFHCCSVHSTQTRPARFARSPHPKAKGLLTPSPLAAPEGRIAVPEWDDAAAGALRGDPRASITKGEAEANDDLCSLCAANHDIPRSLPSSPPPQAARLLAHPAMLPRTRGRWGRSERRRRSLGGAALPLGAPLAHAAPLRAGCLSCGPPQTAPLRVRAPAQPTRAPPRAQMTLAHPTLRAPARACLAPVAPHTPDTPVSPSPCPPTPFDAPCVTLAATARSCRAAIAPAPKSPLPCCVSREGSPPPAPPCRAPAPHAVRCSPAGPPQQTPKDRPSGPACAPTLPASSQPRCSLSLLRGWSLTSAEAQATRWRPPRGPTRPAPEPLKDHGRGGHAARAAPWVCWARRNGDGADAPRVSAGGCGTPRACDAWLQRARVRQGCVCASVWACCQGIAVTVCVIEVGAVGNPDLRLAKRVVVAGCEEGCA